MSLNFSQKERKNTNKNMFTDDGTSKEDKLVILNLDICSELRRCHAPFYTL